MVNDYGNEIGDGGHDRDILVGDSGFGGCGSSSKY